MERFFAYPTPPFPSSSSSPSISPSLGRWAERSREISGSFVPSMLGKFISAIFTFCFAMVGCLLGAMTGALVGQATESGFCRGAGIGAISGAVFSIEVFESSLVLWRSAESRIWSLIYVWNLINSAATTLTGLHFATTILMTLVLRWMGYIQPSHLPLPELLKFILFANFSIVGMNVSLMWNSVGFYQIAKLSMIPVSCFLEVVMDKIRYSRDTKLSIGVVLLGVAVCTVTDVSVNAKGFIAAFIAVWSTALQQYYVHFLQRKYSLGSFNLLGHTAPVQAATLLVLGPFLDFWLTNKRVDEYGYNVIAVCFIILSCTIAVGTNLSQFICIGRFTAVSFQVLGHMKTILVLILGFFFFGKDGLTIQVVLGMVLAVVGMIWYGNASSKPGGKERRSYSISSDKSQRHGDLESSERDDNV